MHVRTIAPLLLCMTLAGAVSPAALAQQETKSVQPKAPADPSLPAADDLFKRHIEALGGEAALRAEKNRVTKGRIQLKGQPSAGQITILRVAPNKMYSTLDLPGMVTVETWFDGERGWVRDSNTGSRALSGEGLAEARRSADFLGEANYKERYAEVRTLAREKLEDRDVYAVEAVTATGRKRILYFDAERSLLIGIRAPSLVKSPEHDSVVLLTEYKKFGEVMQPTRIVQRTGPDETVTLFTSIDANVAPMKSVDPPDEIRNLK